MQLGQSVSLALTPREGLAEPVTLKGRSILHEFRNTKAGAEQLSIYILVVDDEPDVEHLFRQQFRRDIRSGRFVMEFAASAQQALERARRSPIPC